MLADCPLKSTVFGGGAVWNEDGYMPHTKSTDVKNVFYVFLFRSRFYVFLFSKRFYLKNAGKVQSASTLTRSTFEITATK